MLSYIVSLVYSTSCSIAHISCYIAHGYSMCYIAPGYTWLFSTEIGYTAMFIAGVKAISHQWVLYGMTQGSR